MLCIWVASVGFAQTPALAPLGISMQLGFYGYLLPDRALVPAPANIFIHPEITTTMALHAGDTVTIDFIGDGKTLSSARAVWHEAGTFTSPGMPRPLVLSHAQFVVPNCIWTNVPQGSRTVTVRAYNFRGLTASAGPMHFKVIPPLPRQRPFGTHKLTGKQRPAVAPGAVTLLHKSPPGTFDVVGIVSVSESTLEPQVSPEALAELKKQAALMGANGVIVDKAARSKGLPFAGPDGKFQLPEGRLSGRAIYVPAQLQ